MQFRRARWADSAAFYRWRNDPAVRAVSGEPAPIAEAEHQRWWADALTDPRRELYVIHAGLLDVGYLRLDRGFGAWQVSIALDARYRRQGLGWAALRRLAIVFPQRRFRALIKEANTVSIKTFEKAGFHRAPAWEGRAGLRCYERTPTVPEVAGHV